MKYQLVLQFIGEQIEDFDELIKLELDLGLSFRGEHDVDGHDFGSEEMNIFIYTDDPEKALSDAKALLDTLSTKNYVAAFRDVEGEDYTVLFPSVFEGVFCVK